MKRRSILYGVLAIGGLGVAYAVGDALIVTEEERIAPLIGDLAGEVSAARIDAVLAWTAPERQPVEVQALGRTELFEDRAALAARAHEGLRTIEGDTLRILGQSIDVDGERATLSIRFVSSRAGMTNAYFDLRKRDGDWLISTVRVER